MAMSIQTNVNSLVAQENLRANSDFQSKTIQRLTSGFRINQSGDDAAGLAVANKFRSDVMELTQGVRNANDGVSQLQIIDGGLSNISKMLDRMKTLATQSASSTFTGDRTTLNNEYQALVGEIDRQAANIGLNGGGSYNTEITVYIGGGGATQGNSQISVDLSGTANTVDSTGLGVDSTNLLGAGTAVVAGARNLNTSGNVLIGVAGTSQAFNLHLAGGESHTVTVSSAGTSGISVNDAVQQLNNGLSSYGLSAYVDETSGYLKIAGNKAFTVDVDQASVAAQGLTTAASTVTNGSMFRYDSSTGVATDRPLTTWAALTGATTETITFTTGGKSQAVTLTASETTVAATASKLNSTLAGLGIYAVEDEDGGGVVFQSASDFSVSVSHSGTVGATGVFGSANEPAGVSATDAATTGMTGNALTALTEISNAVSNLGLVQGRVGTGQNKLSYAINLAQSQISNFSAAESRIRDTDVAAEAANLTKASVLAQASMAAMAQANSAPQQVLSLLRG